MRIIYFTIIFLIGYATHSKADNLNGFADHDSLGSATMQLNSNPLYDNENLWHIIREGMQLDEVNSDLVRHYEKRFSEQPGYLARVFSRGSQFLFLIASEVKKRGMPTEIVLLPVVESAYRAEATSRVGAAGLWQFMPATGNDYQLTQTWDYDARRDVIRSTYAALTHLQTLYQKFKDWPLALAAYNWGAGNLSRAMAKVASTGQKPTYENISMPHETRHYVPQLLALRNILLSAPKYGLKLDKLRNEPYLAAISVEKNIDMDIAAQFADMSLPEFKALNSGYQLPVFIYEKNRQIVVTKDRVMQFNNKLKEWGEKPLTRWQVYIPDNNVPVQEIAKSFGMDTVEFTSVNRLKNNIIVAGKPILVANRLETNNQANTHMAAFVPSSQIPVDQMINDNLKQILFNPITNDVAPPKHYETQASTDKTNSLKEDQPTQINEHVVSKGETLYSIAQRYHLSLKQLKSFNQLTSDILRPQQILKICPITYESTPIFNQTTTSPVLSIEYIVKKGDTLHSIARDFGVHYTDIKVLNDQSNLLLPGQRVIIPLAQNNKTILH